MIGSNGAERDTANAQKIIRKLVIPVVPLNADGFRDEIRKPEKARVRTSEGSTFRMRFVQSKGVDRGRTFRGQIESTINRRADEETEIRYTNPSSILISPLSLHSYPQCKFLIHLRLQYVVP